MPGLADNPFVVQMKRAFKWHWNLLFLGAGVAVGVLSGLPGVVIPAVAALEMAYLGFLGTNPRFQNVLKGQKLLETAEKQASEQRLRKLLEFLEPADFNRFVQLRDRSREMTELQKSMHTPQAAIGDAGFKTQSLDKLLWLFLKLLHHKTGLERFLSNTSETSLRGQLDDATREVDRARQNGRTERLIASLEEKRTTIRERIENYAEAEENLQVLEAELDKTEQKINHICEVGMKAQDGSQLSSQIDGVAESVAMSERAFGDLQFGGVFQDDSPAPALVSDEGLELE